MNNQPDDVRKYNVLVAETIVPDPSHSKQIGVIYPISLMPGSPTDQPHVAYCWTGFRWALDTAFVPVPVTWLENANHSDVLEDVSVESNRWYKSQKLATCRVRRATSEEVAADLNRHSMTRLSEELRTVKADLDIAEREFIRLHDRYAQLQAEYAAARQIDDSSRPLSFENPSPPEVKTTIELAKKGAR